MPILWSWRGARDKEVCWGRWGGQLVQHKVLRRPIAGSIVVGAHSASGHFSISSRSTSASARTSRSEAFWFSDAKERERTLYEAMDAFTRYQTFHGWTGDYDNAARQGETGRRNPGLGGAVYGAVTRSLRKGLGMTMDAPDTRATVEPGVQLSPPTNNLNNNLNNQQPQNVPADFPIPWVRLARAKCPWLDRKLLRSSAQTSEKNNFNARLKNSVAEETLNQKFAAEKTFFPDAAEKLIKEKFFPPAAVVPEPELPPEPSREVAYKIGMAPAIRATRAAPAVGAGRGAGRENAAPILQDRAGDPLPAPETLLALARAAEMERAVNGGEGGDEEYQDGNRSWSRGIISRGFSSFVSGGTSSSSRRGRSSTSRKSSESKTSGATTGAVSSSASFSGTGGAPSDGADTGPPMALPSFMPWMGWKKTTPPAEVEDGAQWQDADRKMVAAAREERERDSAREDKNHPRRFCFCGGKEPDEDDCAIEMDEEAAARQQEFDMLPEAEDDYDGRVGRSFRHGVVSRSSGTTSASLPTVGTTSTTPLQTRTALLHLPKLLPFSSHDTAGYPTAFSPRTGTLSYTLMRRHLARRFSHFFSRETNEEYMRRAVKDFSAQVAEALGKCRRNPKDGELHCVDAQTVLEFVQQESMTGGCAGGSYSLMWRRGDGGRRGCSPRREIDWSREDDSGDDRGYKTTTHLCDSPNRIGRIVTK